MSEYFKGLIKVVNSDMMCFPVDPLTLEALATGCYDPNAFITPDPNAMETISVKEWYKRLKVKL